MTSEAKVMIQQAMDLLEESHRILAHDAKARSERDPDREQVMKAMVELSEIDLGAETAWEEFIAIPRRSE